MTLLVSDRGATVQAICLLFSMETTLGEKQKIPFNKRRKDFGAKMGFVSQKTFNPGKGISLVRFWA